MRATRGSIGVRERCAIAFVAAGLLLAGGATADVLSLVRSDYYEGVPYEKARAIAPEDVAILAELLADPGERRHHGKVISVLGVSGQPGAYEAVASYAAEPPQGVADGASYQARLAIPIALGHLGRRDGRALADLLRASRDGSRPEWSHAHLAGLRLERLLHRRVLHGLALTARVEAKARLIELRDERTSRLAASAADPEFARELSSALAMHQRIERDGADRVFDSLGGAR